MRKHFLAAVLLLGTSAAAPAAVFTGNVTWAGIGPVPGMKLTVVAGFPTPTVRGSAVTDAFGNFTLAAGFNNYATLTGSLPVPGIDNYLLFSNTTGLDFQMTVGTSGGTLNFTIPPLAIFVPDIFQNGTSLLSAAGTEFGVHPSNNMHAFRVVDLGANWLRSHADNAKILDAEINKVRAGILKALNMKMKPIDVDVVGYGVGGLTARAYVANHTGRTGENRCRRCVTMVTPHLGMVWATLLPPTNPLLKSSITLYQSRVDYMMQQFSTQLRGGYGTTAFYLIGSARNKNPMEPEAIPGWPFSKDDDSFVSTYSATDKSWGGTVVATATVNCSHANGRRNAMSQVATWLR